MIKEEWASEGSDVVLEATVAQSCIQTGVHLVKNGPSCISDHSTGCYPVAVDLLASGKIDVKKLIANRSRFDQAEGAFELVSRGKESAIKVVIQGYQDKEEK